LRVVAPLMRWAWPFWPRSEVGATDCASIPCIRPVGAQRCAATRSLPGHPKPASSARFHHQNAGKRSAHSSSRPGGTPTGPVGFNQAFPEASDVESSQASLPPFNCHLRELLGPHSAVGSVCGAPPSAWLRHRPARLGYRLARAVVPKGPSGRCLSPFEAVAVAASSRSPKALPNPSGD